SPTTAAYYLNWAEYLSWSNSRIATTMQYLLLDPSERGPSQFFSGLESSHGTPKPTLAAYRLPLFLPAPVTRRRHATVVWGCVRPAHYFSGAQIAQIQYRRGSHGRYVTVAKVRITDSRGYFETRLVFPASGALRVVWSYPHGPSATSRVTPVTVH
ncbi:MAG: hypothetical protein M3010_12990, partial [Candidatus Dormibacteraeota bacterium]|nr:hypothetical protein [Candidatus Dormibacteraeota bacterium]